MPAAATSASAAEAERIRALRAFNRFYTRRIGVLGERAYRSRFSLAETRLLWELAHRPGLTATVLVQELGLDAGYVSRLLAGLRERGLLRAERSPSDGRVTHLSLSAAGRRAFAPLDARSQQEIGELIAPLAEAEQQQLLAATGRIEALLDGRTRSSPRSDVVLRAHRPGDIGWVIERHGALYAAEYGWDQRFEALVARIAADFIDRFDAKREACWIAERDAERLGCVFLVQARDEKTMSVEPGVAQLRLLLVEPSARGLGLGKRLTAECTAFARRAGYRKLRLWTNSVLLAARGIYRAEGYRKLARERHASFGKKLVGEIWELEL